MMSKKQLTAMLCLHITYLLLGASIFYHIESPLEMEARLKQRVARVEIQKLLYQHYLPENSTAQTDVLDKLTDYCGHPFYNKTAMEVEPPIRWDFYHSFFFSYTVVSTIGYGNLSPSTDFGRILMIFYGLFGIPINGILLANLAEYFSKKFIKIYRSYKGKNTTTANKINFEISKLGLFGQIALYLVPGFLFFIFLPSCLFMLFEGWDYYLSIYYAFVTLTTIGFGDYVAGTVNNGFGVYFIFYEIFLIIWITFGLGYLVMLLGFITSAMRSKKILKLEHKLAKNLKATQSKILTGFAKDVSYLRRIINEAYLLRFKPVYCDVPTPRLHRSASCPQFTFDVEIPSTGPTVKRRRANSESLHLVLEMQRVQSDTDLLGIDKQKTFTTAAIIQPAELIARVVDALGSLKGSEESEDEGVNVFSDEEILASERDQNSWTIGTDRIFAEPPKSFRNRAASVAPVLGYYPNTAKDSVSYPWNDSDESERVQKEWVKARKFGKMSLPTGHVTHIASESDINETRNLFAKLNPFRRRRTDSATSKADTLEPPEKILSPLPTDYLNKTKRGRASMFTPQEQYVNRTKDGRPSLLSLQANSGPEVLEQTSVADLIRALAALHSRVPVSSPAPRRKLGTAGLTPTRMPSLMNILGDGNTMPQRRMSVRSDLPVLPNHHLVENEVSPVYMGPRRRRLSVRNPPHLSHYSPGLSTVISGAELQPERRRSLLLPPPYSPRVRVNEVPSTGLLERRRYSPMVMPSAGTTPTLGATARRLSLRPGAVTGAVSSRQGLFARSRHDSEGTAAQSSNIRNPVERIRHESLTDVFIDKNKP